MKVIFNLMDAICAEALEVPVKDYVYKIEKTTNWRMNVIIGVLLSDNKVKIQQAKRCFNSIPND